jgi:hypothetical protein
MRYVITQGQFHRAVYKYLQDLLDNGTYKQDYPGIHGNTRIFIYEGTTTKDEVMLYIWHPPGSALYISQPHNGVGYLYIDDSITSTLGKLLSVRPNTVMDIVADWFTETFEYDVDDVEVSHPEEELPY